MVIQLYVQCRSWISSPTLFCLWAPLWHPNYDKLFETLIIFADFPVRENAIVFACLWMGRFQSQASGETYFLFIWGGKNCTHCKSEFYANPFCCCCCCCFWVCRGGEGVLSFLLFIFFLPFFFFFSFSLSFSFASLFVCFLFLFLRYSSLLRVTLFLFCNFFLVLLLCNFSSVFSCSFSFFLSFSFCALLFLRNFDCNCNYKFNIRKNSRVSLLLLLLQLKSTISYSARIITKFNKIIANQGCYCYFC